MVFLRIFNTFETGYNGWVNISSERYEKGLKDHQSPCYLDAATNADRLFSTLRNPCHKVLFVLLACSWRRWIFVVGIGLFRPSLYTCICCCTFVNEVGGWEIEENDASELITKSNHKITVVVWILPPNNNNYPFACLQVWLEHQQKRSSEEAVLSISSTTEPSIYAHFKAAFRAGGLAFRIADICLSSLEKYSR